MMGEEAPFFDLGIQSEIGDSFCPAPDPSGVSGKFEIQVNGCQYQGRSSVG
jgi:hypothetical protein